MPSCDLCDEYTTDPTHCDWCGRERPTPAPAVDVDVDIELPPPSSERPPFTPFAEAIAPVRTARRAEIGAASTWALAHGLPCDRDVVALCLEVLDRFRGPGGLELTRVDVNHVLTCDAGNWSAMHGAMRADDIETGLWVVLHALVEAGDLHPDCDPFPALLEPLQCYGELGPDGRRRPDGVDIDFACQCFLPHDPDCPDDMVQHIVGHHRETFEPFVVHADIPPRSFDPPVSVFDPLRRMTRRVRAADGVYIPRIEEFVYVGRIPRSKLHPELWMYQLTPVARRGFDPLVLDEHGAAFRAKADRRRKLGYRWSSLDDFSAMYPSGVAARELATDRRPPRWDDDGPLPGRGLRAV